MLMYDADFLPEQQLEVFHPVPGVGVLAFIGEHDLSTSERVRQLLLNLVEQEEIVVADLTEATFIDSHIIQALALAERRATERGAVFRLELGDADVVHQALRVTGAFDRLRHLPPQGV